MNHKRWGVCLAMLFIFATGASFCNSGSVHAQETDYEYDESGRVTRVVYEDGSYTEYVYDANGNLLKTVYVEASDMPSEEQSTTEEQNTGEEQSTTERQNDSENSISGEEHSDGGNTGTAAYFAETVQNMIDKESAGTDTSNTEESDAEESSAEQSDAGNSDTYASNGKVPDGEDLPKEQGISRSLKTGIITGSIIVGIVLIGTILWLLILKRRKRGRETNEE